MGRFRSVNRGPWIRLLRPPPDAALAPAEAEAIRPLVIAAVARYDSLTPRLFDVDTFAGAVRDAYGLRRVPAPGWCEGVLGRLPYVAKAGGYRTWKYAGD